MRVTLAFLWLSVMPCLLPAQTTWIVDASGGGSFTDLQSAVQAANDGDVILVRPTGTYDWTGTVSKRLAILGSGSARTNVTGTLTIANLRADQQLVLANFDAWVGLYSPLVSVVGCAGRVVVTDVQLIAVGPPGLTVTDSAHVAIHGSNLLGRPALGATRSSVTVSSSTIRGSDGYPYLVSTSPSTAVHTAASRIELSDCSIVGGNLDMLGLQAGTAEAGMRLQGSAVVLTGGSVMGGRASRSPPGTHGVSIVRDALSSLTIDGSAQLPDGVTGGAPVVRERARVSGALVAPGGVATFTLAGPAGSLGALAIAWPGGPVPGALGTLWVDVGSVSWLALGALPAAGIQGTVAVPPGVPRGIAVSLQGLLLHQGDLTASPPLLDAVR